MRLWAVLLVEVKSEHLGQFRRKARNLRVCDGNTRECAIELRWYRMRLMRRSTENKWDIIWNYRYGGSPPWHAVYIPALCTQPQRDCLGRMSSGVNGLRIHAVSVSIRSMSITRSHVGAAIISICHSKSDNWSSLFWVIHTLWSCTCRLIYHHTMWLYSKLMSTVVRYVYIHGIVLSIRSQYNCSEIH